MQSNVSEHLKQVAKNAASFLGSVVGLDAFHALKMCGLVGERGVATADAPFGRYFRNLHTEENLQRRTVGIWSNDGSGSNTYVRERKQNKSGFPGSNYLWSDHETIDQKSDKSRIILVGESVARGFVLDPWRTPAVRLQDILNHNDIVCDYEVIDLACTGINATNLVQLTRSAMQLEPDVVVLFAGNNWWNAYWTAGGDASRDSLFGKSTKEISTYIEGEMAAFTQLILNAISSSVLGAGAKLIVVIPEFNLADWSQEVLAPSWLLPQARNEWSSLLRRAVELERAKQWNDLRDVANRMIAIDDSMNAASLEFLGRSHQFLGEHNLARYYLERARDQATWIGLPNTPRCIGVVQEAMRRLVENDSNIFLVDLPKILAEASDGYLPGRTWFFDYVHMTLEGLDVAIVAITKQIFAALTRYDNTLSVVLPPRTDSPTDRYELANAYFLAALHCAHCSQSDNLIAFWIEKAVNADPSISDVILSHLMDARAGGKLSLLVESANQYACVARKYTKAFEPKQISEFRLKEIFCNMQPQSISEHLRPMLDQFSGKGGKLKSADLAYHKIDHQGYPALADIGDMDLGYLVEKTEISRFMIANSENDELIKLVARFPWAGDSEHNQVKVLTDGSTSEFTIIGNRWTSLHVPSSATTFLEIHWPVPGKAAFRTFDGSEVGKNVNPFVLVYGHLAEISIN